MRAQAGGGMLQNQIGFRDEAPHGQAGMNLIRHVQMRDIHAFLIKALGIGNALIHQGINACGHQEGRWQALK